MQSEKKPDKKRISSDDLQKQHEKKEISRQKLMSDRGSVPRMIYKCDKCRTTPTNIYDILHAFILGYQFPPGFPSVNIDEVKFDKNVYQFVLKVRDF